ncbi:hypothetical protein [Marinobacter sp. LV10R510-11A]|uniref:hypothetical protein n=1 Tax=Marinobacter sp. LV10R510-11A TaxID=1415568 RepID=UPI001D0D4EDD|nr:hypothetical protein [Marinobacter sp. LV10R510-11A]
MAFALADDPDAPSAVALTSSHNLPLVKQLAQLLGENLNYSIRVGLTHWTESRGDAGLDEAKSEFSLRLRTSRNA